MDTIYLIARNGTIYPVIVPEKLYEYLHSYCHMSREYCVGHDPHWRLGASCIAYPNHTFPYHIDPVAMQIVEGKMVMAIWRD
jgi:hypothetical protein